MAKSAWSSVSGLPTGWTNLPGATAYSAQNTATFAYGVGQQVSRGAQVTLLDRGDTSGGVNDPNKFTKASGSNAEVQITPGVTTWIPWKFVVAQDAGDLTKSRIVDVVDHGAFDVTSTNLDEIKSRITAKVDWWRELAPQDLDLSLDADGNLIIALSESGNAKVSEWGVAHQRLELTLNLPLLPVTGKQSLTITNAARFEGADSEQQVYLSKGTASATSFGNELELNKRIYDAKTDSFTSNLRVGLGPDGQLEQDEFIYRITLSPHGTFSSMVKDIVDKLPDGVEFVGFVADQDIASGKVATDWSGAPTTSYTLPGTSLTMAFADGIMTLTKGTLARGTPVHLNFKIRITEYTEGVGITNVVDRAHATITPSNNFPLDISKLSTANQAAVINGGKFEIRNANGVAVVQNVTVVDNKLQVVKDGEVSAVLVTEPGIYTVVEVTPPAGYALGEPITVEVGADGSSPSETFFNTPGEAPAPVGTFSVVKTVAGVDPADLPADLTFAVTASWTIDGEADSQEFVLTPGVAQDGPVLPVGTEVSFTEAVGSAVEIAGYTFTGVLASVGTEPLTGALTIVEGSAPTAVTVTNTYAPIPVPARVSVGNYVWFDSNNDGLQDETDIPLKDVELSVYGPDGQLVTFDADGNDYVATTKTDAAGAYLFANLPVLEPGQSYTVKITTPVGYVPTQSLNSGLGEKDSSTGEAVSQIDLSTDGAQDLTLDFGFVLPKVSVGDFVWVDSNRDGVQAEGEPGIPGVVLVLTGPDGEPVTDVFGNPVTSRTTDEKGKYSFGNLPVLPEGQSYTVTIDQKDPSSITALKPYVPTIDTAEGDFNSSTWIATSGDLTVDGAKDLTLDFGFVLPKVSVGDFVWVDSNRDGVQTEGEPGIPGVVLVLTDPEGKPVVDVFGNPVTSRTTDANGKYSFENLPVLPEGESYTVTIDQKDPSTITALKPYIPTIDTAEGDFNSSTWIATSGDLTVDGAKDLTLDFGFVLPKVSVGDFVWVDSNRDGVQAEGEPGIPGVVLVLTGPDGEPVIDVFGNPVTSKTTDANGKYSFENLPVLPAGQSYTVTIDLEADSTVEALKPYVPTIDTGADKATNSSTGSATSHLDLSTDGAKDLTLDFGFVLPKVSVGDFVWVDSNRDGVQTEGEPGIPGVVLVLTGPDGEPVTDVFGNPVTSRTTDANGKYSFENLPVLPEGQSYTVTIDQKDPSSITALKPYVPTIDTAEGDFNSSTWIATSGDLTVDGAKDLTLDFGFVVMQLKSVDPIDPVTQNDPISPSPTAPTKVLSSTGTQPVPFLAAAFALLLAGGGLLALNRRRQLN